MTPHSSTRDSSATTCLCKGRRGVRLDNEYEEVLGGVGGAYCRTNGESIMKMAFSLRCA